MYNYCTLFDSSYLTRGLAMYESLKKYTQDFHLYIFAFDDNCATLLKKLDLTHATIIELKDFEDLELLSIKTTRSVGEYCWTCTPSIIKYCIENYKLMYCTYLDADLYFFGNPNVLIDEMGDNSILITEHRYTKKYDQSKTSGIYCVQFMTFKNDTRGLIALEWWRKACNEWCYARIEDGKFGDQKYLDDWIDRFEGVYVMQNLGGGVAPWNIQQYSTDTLRSILVFYHFHCVRFLCDDKVDLGGYTLRKDDLILLYKPYLEHLDALKKRILKMDIKFECEKKYKRIIGWKTPFRFIKRKIKQSYNIYRKKYLLEL